MNQLFPLTEFSSIINETFFDSHQLITAVNDGSGTESEFLPSVVLYPAITIEIWFVAFIYAEMGRDLGRGRGGSGASHQGRREFARNH